MKELKVVRILHAAENRVLYDIFAEFFRFIGVFVEEDLIGNSLKGNGAADETDYQITLKLSLKAVTEGEDQACCLVEIDPASDKWKDVTLNNWMDQQASLYDQMGQIQESLRDNNIDFPRDIYEALLKVYIEENIAKAASNLQYYRLKSDIHKETEDSFHAAAQKLEMLGQTESGRYLKDTFMYRYAVLYCKQKVNQARSFRNDEEDLVFAVYDLEKECRDLIKTYPENWNLWVLLGLIIERAVNGYGAAVDAYEHAVKIIGDQPYASHIYYWLGSLHMNKKRDMREAKYAYAKAYALQRKYRNIYKVAVMFESDKDYDHMFLYFRRCLKSLENYKGNMDPLEMEYYYKTAAILCLRYMDYGQDRQNSIYYGEEAISFWDNTIGKVESFYHLYGKEDAVKYQEVSKERIEPRRVCERLAIAYRSLGEMHNYEKCRKRF